MTQIRNVRRHEAGHLEAEVISGELRYFVDNRYGSWRVTAQQPKQSLRRPRPFGTYWLDIPSLRVKLELQRRARAFDRKAQATYSDPRVEGERSVPA